MFNRNRAGMKPDEAITATLTTQPHDLGDFEGCAFAAAKLSELRRQEDDLAARLAAAIRRMQEVSQNKPIPPRDCDREVNNLREQIEALKAEIVAAEHALRAAEGEAATTISKAMKPKHNALRGRVIAALVELRDALDQERCFRADMDNRGVLSGAVIQPPAVQFLNEPGKLEAVIENLKEGL